MPVQMDAAGNTRIGSVAKHGTFTVSVCVEIIDHRNYMFGDVDIFLSTRAWNVWWSPQLGLSIREKQIGNLPGIS
jgi:hypothetical protein